VAIYIFKKKSQVYKFLYSAMAIVSHIDEQEPKNT